MYMNMQCNVLMSVDWHGMHCEAENSNKQAQIQPMLANRLAGRQHMLYRSTQDSSSEEKLS